MHGAGRVNFCCDKILVSVVNFCVNVSTTSFTFGYGIKIESKL